MTDSRMKSKEQNRVLWLYDLSEEIGSEVYQLTAGHDYEVYMVRDLSQMGKGQETKEGILLLDASNYEEDYPEMIRRVREGWPEMKILVLLPDDSIIYCSHMLEAGADMAFPAEELGRLLLPCLRDLRQLRTFTGLPSEPATNTKEENQMTKKNETGIFQKPVSRRTFLKGSMAATAAAGALSLFGCSQPGDETTAGTTPAETIPETTPEAPVVTPVIEEQVYCGACRGNCAGGCFLNIHVRDGKVVRTSARDLPDPRYNRICIKGLTHMYRMYSPDRLKYPLRRVGERGAGQWEQISWDEAIKEISDKWKGYQAEFGTQSVGIYVGSGNYAVASGEGLGCATTRFMNTIGATSINADVDLARGAGAAPVIGTGIFVTGHESADMLNAKSIFCWGANPVNSQQQTTHFILEAKDQGAKLVVIDPMYTATAAKADVYVPIRPGTDAVLAMAMMNVILRDDLADWDFIYKHSDAPMLVKATDGKYLRLSDIRALADGEADSVVVMGEDGKVDIPANVAKPVITGTYEVNGISVTCVFDLLKESMKEYTPEKASEICNVPVAQIEEIAKIYAEQTPSTIYIYFGPDHYVNGLYAYRAIADLAVMTGNLGKPGAFCGMNETLATNVVNFMTMMVDGGVMSPITVPFLQLHNVLETGKFRGVDVNLKSMYVAHANVIGNSAERQTVLKMLEKIDFIVMADLNMNETAQYADILLPAAHWFEVDDAYLQYSTHPFVLKQEKAVEPPYECKSDYQIYRLIADAMGYPQAFSISEEEFIKLWMDTDGARAVGMNYEDLMEKKALRWAPENYIFNEGGNFGTTTGRGQFYNEAPAVNIDFGQDWNPDHERLPYWEPPHEAWHENPKHEQYPFNLLNIHPKWRTHSQWFDVPVLEEISGKPKLHMNPEDAAAKGIAEGDVVKVYNDRGYVVIEATLNAGMQPGCVGVPKGWEKGQFIEGHYQDLTSRVMHPMINNSAFFDALCNVEKV